MKFKSYRVGGTPEVRYEAKSAHGTYRAHQPAPDDLRAAYDREVLE